MAEGRHSISKLILCQVTKKTYTYGVDDVVLVHGLRGGAGWIVRTHEVDLVVHVHVDDMIIVTRLEPEIRENRENG